MGGMAGWWGDGWDGWGMGGVVGEGRAGPVSRAQPVTVNPKPKHPKP